MLNSGKNSVIYHNIEQNKNKQEFIVAYYRVSTKNQYDKGFGIDVQKDLIKKFCDLYNHILIAEFEEYQSGTKTDRKILKEAMDYTFKNGAILVVAKLDRLARNLEYFHQIVNSKLRFKALDYNIDDPLWLSIIASFAEKEAQYISNRTKEALAEARKRGIVSGRKKGVSYPSDRINGLKMAEKNKENYIKSIIYIKPILEQLRYRPYQEQADELFKQGFRNFSGNKPSINNIKKYRKYLGLGLLENDDEYYTTDEEQEKIKDHCLDLISTLNLKDLKFIVEKMVNK